MIRIPASNKLKKLGKGAFLFFLLKGLIWLAIFGWTAYG